jgi:transposase
MSKAQFAEKIAVHVSTINTWDEDHPPKGGILAATVRARRLLEGKKGWKLDV